MSLNTDMKNLTLQSTELNPEYNTKKREGSESTDSQPSSKKRSLMMMETIMVDPGPSGGSGGFPSSSSSAPSQGGSSSDISSRSSAEANSSDLNQIYWLDIFLIKALFGDDDYMS